MNAKNKRVFYVAGFTNSVYHLQNWVERDPLQYNLYLLFLFTYIPLKHVGIFMSKRNLSYVNNVSTPIPAEQVACIS